MDKNQLRKSTIKFLKQLSESKRNKIESKLANYLFQSSIWKKSDVIGITMAQGFEWNTKIIIEEAWEQGKTVCVPKCDPREKTLTFYKLQSYEQLEVVYYGLLEPKPDEVNKIDKKLIDLLIVPGLLFDSYGYRIGFGGGYYDRFLIDFPNETVSLFSAEQLMEEVPTEPFDIAVKHLITEKGILR
ncbi:5-formyltetrahydrofolate cyclo-ligase [Virgibacillus byunsanensis]|uniref:5-formyltetrahydrofolate cyclo-ligase n=1 Tax=Virgibacillus byunsanensis TaxID=570945 RepID=A0ABW3LKZ2_9BACI